MAKRDKEQEAQEMARIEAVRPGAHLAFREKEVLTTRRPKQLMPKIPVPPALRESLYSIPRTTRLGPRQSAAQ